jgi:hypothetical protein
MQSENEQPKPDYDFILKADQKSKGRNLKLSGPVLVMAILIILCLILAVVGTVLGAKSKKTTGLQDVLGQATEISRVSGLNTKFKDPAVTALSVTTQNVTASEQAQLTKYMKDHKMAINKKKLASYLNKSTDTALSGAAANNTADTYYANYLKKYLSQYSNALKDSFAGSKDPSAKLLLKDFYQSTQTLLSAPPLKNL